MFRTLLLSLLMMALLTSLFPLSDWASGSALAYWNTRLAHLYSGRDRAHYGHRHSRAWWRRRARWRRARALAALQRRRLAAARSDTLAASDSNWPTTLNPYRINNGLLRNQRGPLNLVLPARWSGQPATPSAELRLEVRAAGGQLAGTATLTPISTSGASSDASARVSNARLKTLAGLPFAG